jgi:hypothetical protein
LLIFPSDPVTTNFIISCFKVPAKVPLKRF